MMLQDFLFNIWLGGISFVLTGGLCIIAGVVVIARKRHFRVRMVFSWVWLVVGALFIVVGAYLLSLYLLS